MRIYEFGCAWRDHDCVREEENRVKAKFVQKRQLPSAKENFPLEFVTFEMIEEFPYGKKLGDTKWMAREEHGNAIIM